MPDHQLLDNITHKDVHVITEHSPQLTDKSSYSHVFISEFRDLQAHYPIFFQKNALFWSQLVSMHANAVF